MYVFFVFALALRYLILLLPYSEPRLTLFTDNRSVGVNRESGKRSSQGEQMSISLNPKAFLTHFGHRASISSYSAQTHHKAFTSDSITRHSLCIHHDVPLSACDGFTGLFPSPFVRDLLLGEGWTYLSLSDRKV